MSEPEIHIAGAGPSGLSAALCLARKGRKVVVHEAQARVGPRWQGGFQMLQNFTQTEDVLRLLSGSGIDLACTTQAVHEMTLFGSKSRPAPLRCAEPIGYLLRRGPGERMLDGSLLRQAREAGVDVRFGSRIRDRSGVSVWATGPSRADGLGFETSFSTGLSDRMHVLLDQGLTPAGYAYLFVSKGWATLGMAIVRRFKEADRVWKAVMDRFQSIEAFETGEARRRCAVASFCLPGSLRLGRTLVVGEAAGFQDYLLGFGIRSALLSGVMAARALTENLDYDCLWQKQLRPQMLSSLWLRHLYETGGQTATEALIRLARLNGNPRNYLRWWYQPSWWKTFMIPLIRCRWRKRLAPLPGV
ncbi:MAG: NAD(P)-binding protein [Candidatus Omnitrophica bacterium]|nr:NAD(P)-binding protein [Candidatus Omnitrophota bacterium]